MPNRELDPLVLDLIEWIGDSPRPYSEVIEAWRTSCPRLTVWEEAIERELIERRQLDGYGTMVVVTANGLAFLRQHRAKQMQFADKPSSHHPRT